MVQQILIGIIVGWILGRATAPFTMMLIDMIVDKVQKARANNVRLHFSIATDYPIPRLYGTTRISNSPKPTK